MSDKIWDVFEGGGFLGWGDFGLWLFSLQNFGFFGSHYKIFIRIALNFRCIYFICKRRANSNIYQKVKTTQTHPHHHHHYPSPIKPHNKITFHNKQSFRQLNSLREEEQINKIKPEQLLNILHLIEWSDCTFENISTCVHVDFVTFVEEVVE